MRCAACDEGGLDTGTTQNRSSLGVLLVMRGGFGYRHWTEQIKMRCADSHEVNRGLDAGTTLNRSR